MIKCVGRGTLHSKIRLKGPETRNENLTQRVRIPNAAYSLALVNQVHSLKFYRGCPALNIREAEKFGVKNTVEVGGQDSRLGEFLA